MNANSPEKSQIKWKAIIPDIYQKSMTVLLLDWNQKALHVIIF